MTSGNQINFGAFRLDLVNERLWRDEQSVAIAPKDFAVLRHLIRHPGRLVTKDELLEAAWPGATAPDGALKVSIRKLRAALDDDSKSPRFIETSHRRGYRFIGQIAEGGGTEGRRDRGTERRGDGEMEGRREEENPSLRPSVPPSLRPSVSPSLRLSVSPSLRPSVPLVGREAALEQLCGYLERARRGERQVVFVTGAAGIGKTALVEAFLEGGGRDPEILVGHGQCLEQYGAGEAYLPVLEAVTQLCRGPGREWLVGLLRRHAPTWLQQMPAFVRATDREALQREVFGATGERMLREMAEALEALAGVTPLALVLEDLHWSDYSTLDLISYLARRRGPARLLVIGVYRPVDVILSGHPLRAVKQELDMRKLCEELAVDSLSEAAVGDYLAARFPSSAFPDGLARLIHERTDGRPLFMVNVVDYLLARGLIIEIDGRWALKIELAELELGVPQDIRGMIDKQIDRLDEDEQQALEAASVVGIEFSAAAVAACLEEDEVRIEDRLERLAQRCQFVSPAGISEWAGVAVTTRYGFVHSLYMDILYERMAAARRARYHLRIGEKLENAYGERVGEIAAKLAVHFEKGREFPRAIKYLRRAAHNATRRYANQEAISHLTRALEISERLPESERAASLMAALEQRGAAYRSMGEMRASADDFTALAALAREQGQVDAEARALIASAIAVSWIDIELGVAALEQSVALIPRLTDELLRAHTRSFWGHWRSRFLGWSEEDARSCAEVIEAARRAGHRELLSLHVGRYSYFDCMRSNYRAAVRTTEEGMRLAMEVGGAFDYLYCQYYRAWALLHLGEWSEMLLALGEGMELAEKNGHRLAATLLRLETAWLHEQAFDFDRARELCAGALEQAREAGHATSQSLSLILLGIAYNELGQFERASLCFGEITNRLEREPGFMELIFQLPLRLGLSENWLARREFNRARLEAEALCELAGLPGERTYLALGRRTLTEIALAEQNSDRAEEELSQALAALEGAEAPLAEWRVYETAARLYEQQGRRPDADLYWTRSAATLNRLADSLAGAAGLRASLLNHPRTRAILDRVNHRRNSAA